MVRHRTDGASVKVAICRSLKQHKALAAHASGVTFCVAPPKTSVDW
jgi:hypothetical protein